MRSREGRVTGGGLSAVGVVLVAGLTLLSGAIHGRMSNRWGPPRNVLAAAEKLKDIPNQFGCWQLKSSEEIDESIVSMLECTGYILRTYVNEETGEAVRVAILVGPSGPISVHTPDICFSSQDYSIALERERVTVPESSDEEFWTLTFLASNIDADVLRVYYAWSTGDHWSAPREPRFAFARYPYLYKLQLVGSLPLRTDTDTGDPCRKFLEDFAPVARKYLVEAG